MARVIVVTSGKGGVGKSSICVNVASHLAKRGNRVCLIDADLGLKNLDVMLGIESRVIFDIQDVINGVCTLNKALVRDKRLEDLYLLPACKSIDVTKINFSYLEKIIIELKKEFDFIFIDSPAGIERGFYNAIRNANEAIVVVNNDTTSIRDADRVIGILHSQSILDTKLVMNKVDLRKIDSDVSISIDDVIDVLNIPLLGVVYDDESVTKANNNGVPILLDNRSIANKCYLNISKRLTGEDIKITRYKRSILERIFS
jgi:septum site-determining protein MinD